MPGPETKSLPSTPGHVTDKPAEEKPKCKACCACPETKLVRDQCIMEKGELECQHLIEAHKEFVPVRQLSDEELAKLAKHDSRPVTEFKRHKLEREAQKNWDKFYQRNNDKFFKHRHWTAREFSELGVSASGQVIKLLEVGCGVGNLLLPLLKENPLLKLYACDFSAVAVDILQNDPGYDRERCQAFVADITQCDLVSKVPEKLDLASLVFVLSAINPEKMVSALRSIRQVLRPGGVILFRDYGLYDHAMIRFGPGQKLGDRNYFRQDGTYTYYFTTEEVVGLFAEAGFVSETCSYVHKETSNKKEDLCVPRVFVQGKFRVPQNEHDQR